MSSYDNRYGFFCYDIIPKKNELAQLTLAQPHTHTHQARVHAFRPELTSRTVNYVRPARHETTDAA